MAVACTSKSRPLVSNSGDGSIDTAARRSARFWGLPEVSLVEARVQHLEARKVLRSGIDPGEKRRVDRLVRVDRSQRSFAAVAAELLALHGKKNSVLTMKRDGRIIEKYLNPYLGDSPSLRYLRRNFSLSCARQKRVAPLRQLIELGVLPAWCFDMPSPWARLSVTRLPIFLGALETPRVQSFASLTEPAAVAPLRPRIGLHHR